MFVTCTLSLRVTDPLIEKGRLMYSPNTLFQQRTLQTLNAPHHEQQNARMRIDPALLLVTVTIGRPSFSEVVDQREYELLKPGSKILWLCWALIIAIAIFIWVLRTLN